MAIFYLTICILSFIGVATAVYIATERAIERQVDLRLEAEATDLLGRPGEINGRSAIATRIHASEVRRSSYTMGYMLVDQNARRIAGTAVLATPHHGYSDVNFSDRLEGLAGLERGRALTTPTPDGDLLIVVADADPIDGSLSVVAARLAIGFGVAALVVAIAMLSMVGSIRSHMRSMRRAAQSIADGNLASRLPESGRDDEFDREATLLNRMLDRIADLMLHLKHVSDDVAHDLRTPLARIRTRLSALTSEPDPETVLEGIHRSLADCDEMLEIFAAILRLSEIESGARRAAWTSVNLSEVVRTAVATMAPVAEAEGKILQTCAISATTMTGDRPLLSQMVIDVIDNGVRHTPAGTVISVSMKMTGNGVMITIADNGPGIAIEARALALRRFGRLAVSRSTPGHGLGFSMITAIARLHGGKVVLTDARPGLRVAIHLPEASVEDANISF